MGITTATIMKLSLLLVSAATATEFNCYTCGFDNGLFLPCKTEWDASTADTVKCNDSNGHHCFTAQTTDKNGNKLYKRGCQQTDMFADFQKGCIKDKCNTHTNLNSSSSSTTGSILAAIFYM